MCSVVVKKIGKQLMRANKKIMLEVILLTEK